MRTKPQPLVLSMSAITTFRRCPKAYDLGYERGLVPLKRNDAVERGADFHTQVAELTLTGKAPEGPMGGVVCTYVAHRPLPPRSCILSVEEPIFTKILPGVWLRTTPDLLYRDAMGTTVVRDYKTFGVAPSLDLDLDFQGRLYLATIMRKFPGENVRFEYEYVRSELFHQKTVGGVKGPDKANPWSAEESYLTYPLSISEREAQQTWDELLETVRDIQRKRKRAVQYPATWTRTDLKGNVNSCKGCFFSNLCRAEYAAGELFADDIAIFADPARRQKEVPA